jgi:MFS family permease
MEEGICSIRLVHAGILMLGAVDFGYNMAFGLPAIDSINHSFAVPPHDHTFTPLFQSATSFMAIFGPVLTYFLLKVVRRRLLISIYGFAGTLFWLLFLALDQNNYKYDNWFCVVLRGLSGITIGGFSTLLPVFMVELSPAGSTGFFGTLFQLAIALGFVLCYAIALPATKDVYRILAGVGAVQTFLIAALVWLIDDVQDDQKPSDTLAVLETLHSPGHMWNLVICILLMVFQQTTGVNVILILRSNKRREQRPVGAASHVVGCIIGAFLIKKIGRRFVWTLSLGVIAIADAVFAITRYYAPCSGHERWIGIVFLLLYGLGAGPIPWFFVPEIFPRSLRMMAMTMIATLNWILAFAVIITQVEIFKDDSCSGDKASLWKAFPFFAILSAGGAIFGFFFVRNPEAAAKKGQVLYLGIYDEIADQ